MVRMKFWAFDSGKGCYFLDLRLGQLLKKKLLHKPIHIYLEFWAHENGSDGDLTIYKYSLEKIMYLCIQSTYEFEKTKFYQKFISSFFYDYLKFHYVHCLLFLVRMILFIKKMFSMKIKQIECLTANYRRQCRLFEVLL